MSHILTRAEINNMSKEEFLDFSTTNGEKDVIVPLSEIKYIFQNKVYFKNGEISAYISDERVDKIKYKLLVYKTTMDSIKASDNYSVTENVIQDTLQELAPVLEEMKSLKSRIKSITDDIDVKEASETLTKLKNVSEMFKKILED